MELRLHLAPSYRLENGALQPITKELHGSTTLSFDRRKTVGDLRLAIYQVMWVFFFLALAIKAEQNDGIYFFPSANMNAFEKMQELWEGDMALTVAKSLAAGLHLTNTLTGEMITGEWNITTA